MTGGFDFEGLLGTMSPDALRETVRRLVGVYGEGAEEIVMETADGFTRRVSENIRDRVSRVLGTVCDHVDIDHEPEAMIPVLMEDEFDGDVWFLLDGEGPDAAEELIAAIAMALRDPDIPRTGMPDRAMGFRRRYADAIEERFLNGGFLELFEGIERSRQVFNGSRQMSDRGHQLSR